MGHHTEGNWCRPGDLTVVPVCGTGQVGSGACRERPLLWAVMVFKVAMNGYGYIREDTRGRRYVIFPYACWTKTAGVRPLWPPWSELVAGHVRLKR